MYRLRPDQTQSSCLETWLISCMSDRRTAAQLTPHIRNAVLHEFILAAQHSAHHDSISFRNRESVLRPAHFHVTKTTRAIPPWESKPQSPTSLTKTNTRTHHASTFQAEHVQHSPPLFNLVVAYMYSLVVIQLHRRAPLRTWPGGGW